MNTTTINRLGNLPAALRAIPEDWQPSGEFETIYLAAVVLASGGVEEALELRQAGIERADAFAAVSSGDNSNIISARLARETFGVSRVVARIYDQKRAQVYERVGIPTVAQSIQADVTESVEPSPRQSCRGRTISRVGGNSFSHAPRGGSFEAGAYSPRSPRGRRSERHVRIHVGDDPGGCTPGN